MTANEGSLTFWFLNKNRVRESQIGNSLQQTPKHLALMVVAVADVGIDFVESA